MANSCANAWYSLSFTSATLTRPVRQAQTLCRALSGISAYSDAMSMSVYTSSSAIVLRMAEPKPRISTVSSDTRRDEDDQVASQTSLTRPAPLPPLFAGHYIVGLPAILRNGLLSLSLGDKLCDLIIRAGDREFIAHTAVVFSQSEPLSSCCKVDKDPVSAFPKRPSCTY